MIRKLQRKFIMIAGLAVIIMMVCFLVPVNLISHYRVGNQLHKTLRFIIESDGDLDGYNEWESENEDDLWGVFDALIEGNSVLNLTPESEYQLRYFLVMFDANGDISDVSLSHIAAVDWKMARSMAEKTKKRHLDHGFLSVDSGNYYYLKVDEADGSQVIGFLDCTRELDYLSVFYYSSIGFATLLVSIFLILIAVISKRAMKPYVENMESQREFITNAGHELKTPLAIISANTEVIEMMYGKNEWTESILSQVGRGTTLINELITLSRTSEDREIVLTEVDFSKTAAESAESFRPVIEQMGKHLETQIEDSVMVKGDARILSELCNILIDNAAKYCDDSGTVSVTIRKRGRGGQLMVSNNFKDGERKDYSRFFGRFYRGDTSHNSKQAGYGIGLSMAQTITEKMKGNIKVGWKDGIITFTVTM